MENEKHNLELIRIETLETNTILKLIEIKRNFEELKTRQSNLNKYQNICFESIIEDLKGMQSFVKSLQFYRESMENNKIDGYSE